MSPAAPVQLGRRRLIGAATAFLVLLAAALIGRLGGGGGKLGEIRAPLADTAAEAPALAPLPPSLLSVPVLLDLAPLLEEVESGIPREWGDLESRLSVPDNDRLEVAFDLSRSPFRASFEGAVARLGATISYRARAWYDPPLLPPVSVSCGTGDDEDPPRLDVALAGPLSLDAEWRLRSEVAVARVEPVSESDRDRCRVSIIRWDMTERVVQGARDLLTREAETIDSMVAEVDVRSKFVEWWELIGEPIELTDDVWLVLGGETLVRGPIEGHGDRVETVLGLRARPRIVVGPRPDDEIPPLPPLDSAGVTPGFAVRVEARAEYAEAGAVLSREVGGEELSAGGRTVRLDGFEVSGVGDGRIALAVDLSGDASGRLYLVGTPEYDPTDGRIGVPDLDFDVASERAIVEGAAWLARVGLVGILREAARWPTEPAMEWAREQVERGLNRRLSDDVALEGRVADVVVVDAAAGDEALLVRADVRAEASLIVGGARPAPEAAATPPPPDGAQEGGAGGNAAGAPAYRSGNHR